MSERPAQELSIHEMDIAEQAHELFEDLDAAEFERVLADVQRRRAADHARSEALTKSGIMFSRGPGSPLGKLTCVAKTKLDEITFERFLQYCAGHSTDVATVLRDWVYYVLYRKSCQQMLAERITAADVVFNPVLAERDGD